MDAAVPGRAQCRPGPMFSYQSAAELQAPGSTRASARPRVDDLSDLGPGRLHAKIGNRPSGTYPRPRHGATARRDVHDPAERLAGRACRPDLAGQLGTYGATPEPGWEQPIPLNRTPRAP